MSRIFGKFSFKGVNLKSLTRDVVDADDPHYKPAFDYMKNVVGVKLDYLFSESKGAVIQCMVDKSIINKLDIVDYIGCNNFICISKFNICRVI